LHVSDITPSDMVLDKNPPDYGFTLSDSMQPINQLRCFASSFGAVDVTLIGTRAEVRLPGAFTGTRGRINCTMPSYKNRGENNGNQPRWRWFGRQFLTR